MARNRQTLRKLLDFIIDENLKKALRKASLPLKGVKMDRIEVLIDNLLNGYIQLESDILKYAAKDTIIEMCYVLDLDYEQNKDLLKEYLEEWFQEEFGDRVKKALYIEPDIALENLLYCMSSKSLYNALINIDSPVAGDNIDERVALLHECLLQRICELDDILVKASTDEIVKMCRTLSIDHDQVKDYLITTLCKWFKDKCGDLIEDDLDHEDHSSASLDELLCFMNCDDLRAPLRDAGLKTTGTKIELIKRIIQALTNGEIDFYEDILAYAYKTDLIEMCRLLNIDSDQRRDDLEYDLECWFESVFGDVIVDIDDDPDVGPSFKSKKYRKSLHLEFKYLSEKEYETRPYQEKAVEKVYQKLIPGHPQCLHIATGGGKTFIANNILIRWLEKNGNPILWVAKDWRLLWQAARDLCNRYEGYLENISRIGGDTSIIAPLEEEKPDASVFYTTLHTIKNRLDSKSLIYKNKPTLVIWDECHWGQTGKTGRRLMTWCKKANIPLLGLTATPKEPQSQTLRFSTAFSCNFNWLVRKKYLAKPVLNREVKTGVKWAPNCIKKRFDFQLDSLNELAENDKRNKLIVHNYEANYRKYGKTFLFACNIEHANILAELFSQRGIPARPIHSQKTHFENENNLEAFRNGDIQVITNVAKLTHGIDVPDARTVFLCRPTMSDILFSQMVGRAARIDKKAGKTNFNIVEFTDNLERFADNLLTAKKYFKGASLSASSSTSTYKRTIKLHNYDFDPNGKPAWIVDSPPNLPEIRGLWYIQNQTFGIEFELTSDSFNQDITESEWKPIADALLMELENELGASFIAKRTHFQEYEGEADHGVWNVEWDGSCGWEVTSRILQNKEGFEEIVKACNAINKVSTTFRLRLNAQTGTHLHMGWKGKSIKEIKNALLLTKAFEPALGTLVAPSRLAFFDGESYDISEANPYCQPVSAVFSKDALEEVASLQDIWKIASSDDDRYISFNIRPLRDIQTVEIRLHSGTTDAGKILLWVSLWMQLLWAANTTQEEIPHVKDCTTIIPNGDIINLVKRYLTQVQQDTFLRKLTERKAEVKKLWAANHDLQPWLNFQ